MNSARPDSSTSGIRKDSDFFTFNMLTSVTIMYDNLRVLIPQLQEYYVHRINH